MVWLAVVATIALSSSSLQDAGTVRPHPALSLPSPRNKGMERYLSIPLCTLASLNRCPFAASVHEPLLAACMVVHARKVRVRTGPLLCWTRAALVEGIGVWNA
jgi:hypothetical protein